jgi:hypothetical protein
MYTTIALVTSSLGWAGSPFEDAFPAEAIDRFTFDQSAGAVIFKVDPNAGRLVVRGQPESWNEQGCGIDMGQREGDAWLRLLTEKASIMRVCRANWDITVPPHVALDITFSNGDVTLTGTHTGALQVSIGSGDFTFEGASGTMAVSLGNGQLEGAYSGTELSVAVGSGGIHLSELITPVTAELGLGNISLSYQTAPTGELRLRTGTGAISVLLPEGTPVHTDFHGVGARRVDLPKRPSATTRIYASTGIGKIRIAALPAPPAPESDRLDE